MAERLTPTFVQELLSSAEPYLTVKEVLVKPGSGRGDNYTAMLYRLDVRGVRQLPDTEEKESCELSLIYKCLPASPERRQAYRSDNLFSNEVAFYTRALPALLDFQRSRGVEGEAGFSAVPRCHTARYDLLLLEDLRARNFVMLDRKEGLGEAQCRAVLSELAKFHALSLAMRAQKPTEFSKNVAGSIREALFVPENEKWYRNYYAAACKSALTCVQELLPAEYTARFETFTCGFFARMTSLVAPSQPITGEFIQSGSESAGKFTDPIVLCHGDCWTNNILFRFEEDSEKVLEVCLLDFQLARVGSPALDLANLLYCCTSRQLRASKLTSLLRHYHEQLVRTLKALGIQEPGRLMSWDTLGREMKRYAAFGLGLALDMIPISTCESAEAPDLYHTQQYISGVPQGQDEEVQGCALLQAPPTQHGKQMMADLVQELVDQNFI